MRIFHIATLADWKGAEASGTYTTSTYGVPLAEAGFLHAARHEQVRGVLDTHYAEGCGRFPACGFASLVEVRGVPAPSPEAHASEAAPADLAPLVE